MSSQIKISQLPNATLPVSGSEVLPIVQNATTSQISILNLSPVLLSTVSANQASIVEFTSSLFSSSYGKYIIEFDGVYGSVGGHLYCRISNNNSYLTSNYNYSAVNISSAGLPSYAGSSAGGGDKTAFIMGWDVTTGWFSTSSFEGAMGTLKFSNPKSTRNLFLSWDLTISNITSQSDFSMERGGGSNTSKSVVDAIKLYFSSGTISGNFQLFGIKGS